jgi:hypothetical protein
MTCPYCEIHKLSAAMWRNKAYELGGTPLPWDADKKIEEAIAAEREAVLDTVDELMGMERDRHPMFSEGYDYALLHIKKFVTARSAK